MQNQALERKAAHCIRVFGFRHPAHFHTKPWANCNCAAAMWSMRMWTFRGLLSINGHRSILFILIFRIQILQLPSCRREFNSAKMWSVRSALSHVRTILFMSSISYHIIVCIRLTCAVYIRFPNHSMFRGSNTPADSADVTTTTIISRAPDFVWLARCVLCGAFGL